jgi:hypothetical protein
MNPPNDMTDAYDWSEVAELAARPLGLGALVGARGFGQLETSQAISLRSIARSSPGPRWLWR